MNDICRDTALVRLSDAAGFETEDEKKRPRPEPLNHIIDETTTQDELVEILERAFFTCRIDKDGDIVVRDLINFYIYRAADGLLLASFFDFREGMDREAMQAVTRAANSGDWLGRFRLGDEVDFVRAEHYVVLKGGITVRNFGQTLRR
jgi:hypothetical protein